MRRLVGAVVPVWAVIVMGLSIAPVEAATFAWKSRFTKASSPQLVELHELLHAARLERLSGHPVQDLVWTEPDFELRLVSGTLYTEPPLDGRVIAGYFEGKATISFTPQPPTARTALQMHFGDEELAVVPVNNVTIFSLRPDSPLARLGAEAGGTPPAAAGSYADDKSALRQMGLRLTSLYLNRESAAKNATFFLFPMEAIRTSHNEEARLLYANDPVAEQSVSLSVFGHEEMSEYKPLKFKFHPIVEYAVPSEFRGLADVRTSRVVLAPDKVKPRSSEKATLDLEVGEGVRALRFELAIEMELTGVQDGQGKALPFLQWEKLHNDPDFDQSVLVSIQDGAPSPGRELSLVFESSGVLFEPWGSSFYLVNEDTWAPMLPLSGDDMQHELDLTFPADLDGIGVGERILEEKKGPLKRVVYRTTHPVSMSTLYMGDYNKTETQADDVLVELYQRRSQLQRNVKYTLTEVANAIKVFNRMYVPLEFRNLRVTDTPTLHGRGFEGLLLLGAGGTSDTDSWTDAFRAHEVAHQWWFNYVRPLDAMGRDRWLSEAFAEYSSLDYYKARFEDPERSLMLMREQWFDPLTLGTMQRESLTGQKQQLVGSTSYPLAAGTQNVYTKGPMVLHMLRYLLQVQKGNDDAWYPMLRDFLQTYKYKRASTEDFRAIAEKHAGVKLDWFFDQWYEDGGVPVLYWERDVSRKDGAWILTLKARQEQKKYRLLVPVYIRFPGDKLIVRPWLIDGESGSKAFKLPAEPSSVSLNDGLESLAILKALDR